MSKIVIEDFSGTICDPKWRDTPLTKDEAESVLVDKCCPICESNLLLPLLRPPKPDWLVHCNHCGSEMLIAVLLNQEAWKA